MRPLVSVIMPVFNGEDFLDEAIVSIRAQSFRDFEFLIIDDGSVDASTEIIRRHCAEDRRILLHSRDHRGQVAAMKFAASIARGQYLARMDADDVSMKGRLEAQLKYLEAHPDVAVLGTQIEFISSTGRLISRSTYPSEPHAVKKELWCSNCLCHSSVMLRRSAYDQAGGYRACFAPAEDNDLWMRIARFSELANLAEFYVKYRINVRGQSFRQPWHQALGLAVARQLMRSQSEPEIAADQPITYERAKELGLDVDELNREITKIYGSYFEFAISLGRHRLVWLMLRDLLKRLNFAASSSGEMLIKIANMYVVENHRILAASYFVSGMWQQGLPIGEILSRLVELPFRREKIIEVETSSMPPPDQMPVGGYIDEYLANENGRELTIIGWSPFLRPAQERNKIVVYSSEEALGTRVRRHDRPDVGEKHQGCERVGFSCWLAFPRAVEDALPVVTVLDNEGRQYRLVSATQENSSLDVQGL